MYLARRGEGSEPVRYENITGKGKVGVPSEASVGIATRREEHSSQAAWLSLQGHAYIVFLFLSQLSQRRALSVLSLTRYGVH